VKPDLDPTWFAGLRAGGGDADSALSGAGGGADIQSVCDGGLLGHGLIVYGNRQRFSAGQAVPTLRLPS
jgi:hypothetical protein